MSYRNDGQKLVKRCDNGDETECIGNTFYELYMPVIFPFFFSVFTFACISGNYANK